MGPWSMKNEKVWAAAVCRRFDPTSGKIRVGVESVNGHDNPI